MVAINKNVEPEAPALAPIKATITIEQFDGGIIAGLKINRKNPKELAGQIRNNEGASTDEIKSAVVIETAFDLLADAVLYITKAKQAEDSKGGQEA